MKDQGGMLKHDSPLPICKYTLKTSLRSLFRFFLSVIAKYEFPLIQVSHVSTLAEAVCKRGFLLKGGTPAFIVLVKNAKFTNDFLSKYTIRE